jgi:hypothetical protein
MKSSQRYVAVTLQKLFPLHLAVENYKHPKVVHSTGFPIELDIFIEDLKLAIEYQGAQHYKPLYWASDFTSQTMKDSEKKIICKKHGITLIEVPYWWDRTPESLALAIHQARPELILHLPQPSQLEDGFTGG